MKKLSSAVILVLFSFVAFSQFDCKVLIENLQGQYNGECKKGLANGEGSAKGVDSYTGEFRKGYPQGFGVYIYANGSNYIGNFRKGLKDGFGLLNTITESGDLVQDYGLWMADSLIGPNDPKALYRVKERKGVKVIRPHLTRDKSVKNQVWINFMIDGVTDKSVVIRLAEITSGELIDTKDRALNTLVAFDNVEEFPVTFKLEYQISKSEKFEKQDCRVEVTLFTPGLWEIDVNH